MAGSHTQLRSRESAAEKGRRYVVEGRLRVSKVDELAGIVAAECRGDGMTYVCGRSEGGWYCSCPAKGRCAHLVAVGLVVSLGSEAS